MCPGFCVAGLVGLGGGGQVLVFGWGSHAEGRVSSLAVVEDLEVVEHRVCKFEAGFPLRTLA